MAIPPIDGITPGAVTGSIEARRLYENDFGALRTSAEALRASATANDIGIQALKLDRSNTQRDLDAALVTSSFSGTAQIDATNAKTETERAQEDIRLEHAQQVEAATRIATTQAAEIASAQQSVEDRVARNLQVAIEEQDAELLNDRSIPPDVDLQA